jgi:hypothetical protein
MIWNLFPSHRPAWTVGLAVLLAACADTSAPLPPAEEVLLVVNRDAASLSVIPVRNPATAVTIPLGGTAPAPTTVAAIDGLAVVPLGPDDAVVVVDLRTGQASPPIALPTGSGATGAAMINDSIAYVANPNLNTVTRVNLKSGDTASVRVGIHPQGMVFTRGRLFVLNGNVAAGVPNGPSWITVIDPVTNARATGIDSISLPGPGNAAFADVASDGLIYVMSSGTPSVEGRLHIVDPVGRTEVANFGGFGVAPGPIAADGGERLFVSSLTEGLMEFNTRTRTVIRGTGSGVNIPENSAVAVDESGQVYAISSGPCQSGQAGTAHVLRVDLSERTTIGLGECAVFAAMTLIQPEGS